MKLIMLFFIVATAIQAQTIKVEDAWVRSSQEGFGTALFFTVVNEGLQPDTLYAVTSGISNEIEIHESYSKGDDMMGMRPVDYVVIEPGTKFQFKPRSFHVMILELKEDLNVADSADFILMFKQAGKVPLKAVVKQMGMMK
ncbi:MAG: copper chaperone PCu(A)C [Ignavibacteriaceae bacterium]